VIFDQQSVCSLVVVHGAADVDAQQEALAGGLHVAEGVVEPRVQRRRDLGVRLPLRAPGATLYGSATYAAMQCRPLPAFSTEQRRDVRRLAGAVRTLACVEGRKSSGTDLHAALVPVAVGIHPQRIQQHNRVRPRRLR
jgi:hypothetical protein